MEWRDEGVILSVRGHGESAAIVELFTSMQGRHAGVVPGGGSRRLAPLLQPGTQVLATWRARLHEHIGSYSIEPLRSRAAILSDSLALAGLNAVCALLSVALPEREPHPGIYLPTIALLDRMAASDDWRGEYLDWELTLLEELGFGLDLGSCAVTGTTEDLAFVSPKSGRAVSRAAAGAWADRLLPYPESAGGRSEGNVLSAVEGLKTTGHFLLLGLGPLLGGRPLPPARERLVAALRRQG
jgi:DNA repair protein RecO (recombination protein O)